MQTIRAPRDQVATPPVTIAVTFGIGRRLSMLAEIGIYGRTVEKVANPRWLDPLRGKDLMCWCPLNQPCHADVLLEIANSVEHKAFPPAEVPK